MVVATNLVHQAEGVQVDLESHIQHQFQVHIQQVL